MQDQRNGGPPIVIIGAGPSGLATGHFLKKRGYQNVLILEALQGRHNTLFVGGATNFGLVEPIVEYAKNLVETHFAPVPSGTRV